MYRISFSRVSTYTQCPLKYEYRYVDGFTVPFDCVASNPLEIGTLLHEYIELGEETAFENYLRKYPVITDAIVDELTKMKVLGRRARDLLTNWLFEKSKFEVKLDCNGFVGYIDMLVPVDEHEWAIVDFKYSNNDEHYLKSPQLSVYKYYFELANPDEKVVKLFYLMVPKTMIRQKKTEDLYMFRVRLDETLDDMQPKLHEVSYDADGVVDFLSQSVNMLLATEYPPVESRLCDFCEYKELCKEGNDMFILPENERRAEEPITNPDMWIYADSYVGKSTFADSFDNVLFLNTDGNVSNITSPYITIADELVTEGRMTQKILAWAKFKEVIEELEKHDNTFEVIVLDLIEDLYEHCRLYVYDQLGIKHESDSGYGKGWDIVKTEFLSTMKHVRNLGYRVIYISKELVTEITYANGLKVSTFKPNIPDKIANVLAGTVTMTLRAYMDERGRFLQLRKNENVFGGGRIDFKRDFCALNREAFEEALLEAQGVQDSDKPSNDGENASKRVRKVKAEESKEPIEERESTEKETMVEETPKKRTRKRRTVSE